MSFEQFNLNESIMEGVRDAGYTKPTPIQEQAIPHIMAGRDLIGSAQTGTGKTAAFVLPILHRLLENPKPGIRCLILSPTRELATQISDQIWGLGYHTGLTSANIIGGTEWIDQSEALKKGAPIVVATPGRLMDQMRDISIDFGAVEILVLDEADRMLDMGFIPAVTTILSKLPAERQNLLFSATIPGKIQAITDRMMKNPERVNVASFKAADSITQRYYVVPEFHKPDLLAKLIKNMEWKSVIVFTGTKKGADKLQGKLSRRDLAVASIHGDRSQEERDAALNAFKSGQYTVLVATDVIARGIDITDVSHIVNFDIPRDSDDYIHRIGRTGRNTSSGEAITLVSQGELKFLEILKDRLNLEIIREEIPEDIQAYLDQKNHHYEQTRGQKKPRHSGKYHTDRHPRAAEDQETVPAAQPEAGVSADSESQQDKPKKYKNNRYNRNRPQNRPARPEGETAGRPQQESERPQQRPQQRQQDRQQDRQNDRQQDRHQQPRDRRLDQAQQGQQRGKPAHNGQHRSQAPKGKSSTTRVSASTQKPQARKDNLKLSRPGNFLSMLKKFFTGKK